MRLRTVLTIGLAATALGSCSFDHDENPYRGLAAPPPASEVLEALNLADLGLALYPCDLFDTPISRCYRSDHWLGVPEGRTTLAYLDRELNAAGARYWGSSSSPTRDGFIPVIGGTPVGCFFDYQTADYTLRIAVIGPSGEAEPCVNGLPGDGVSEVWIMGGVFSTEAVYGGVVRPSPLEGILTSLPAERSHTGRVYGGADATTDGYYGPQLPPNEGQPGVHIVASTVAVGGGWVRGLVQYGGVAPTPVPVSATSGPSPSPSFSVTRTTTGAVGIVVEVANNRYEVPGVVRLGESVPFELELPAGFDATDVRVESSWRHTNVKWMGGQRITGPASNPACGTGAGLSAADIPELVPSGNACLVFHAQATTADAWIAIDAVVATFAADGTVTEVTSPVLIRGNRGEPATGTLLTNTPDINAAWLAPNGVEDMTGVWIHYAKQDDLNHEND